MNLGSFRTRLRPVRSRLSDFKDHLVEFFIKNISGLGHASKMPLLTAIAWRISLREVTEIPHNRHADRKLIVLAKSGGVEDVKAAFASTPASFRIFLLPRRMVKLSFRHFLSEDEVSNAHYVTSDTDIEKSKLEYRRYLEQVLKYFKALHGCDTMMQFNIVYFAERELAAAASKLGIPFLCNYKECLRSTAFWRETGIWYKQNIGAYGGWKIAVYNDQARETIIRSGIAAPWQVEKVGCARLDYSHKLRDSSQAYEPHRKTVLFFMIQQTAGLPYFGGRFKKDGKYVRETDGMSLNWHALANKTNDVMLKFAKKHPNLNFVFKGKTGHSKMQRERLGESLPGNVKVISDGTGNHLLKEASAVVGFQSTAVLEAIAAGRPTIVPALLSTTEYHLKPYLHDLNGAAVVANSEDELEQALLEAVHNRQPTRELSGSQKQALEKYLGNADGLAGDRLRQFIEDAVYTDLRSQSSWISMGLEDDKASQHGS